MIKLLEVKEVQEGNMKDHITDYIFENSFPLYSEVVEILQAITGYETVEKGKETWLECTHEMIEVTGNTITMRFVKPYCG